MLFTAMKHWYQNKSISIWKTDPFFLRSFRSMILLFPHLLSSLRSAMFKFRVTWIVKETQVGTHHIHILLVLFSFTKAKPIPISKVLFGVDTNVWWDVGVMWTLAFQLSSCKVVKWGVLHSWHFSLVFEDGSWNEKHRSHLRKFQNF